jgi:hypothetical protein
MPRVGLTCQCNLHTFAPMSKKELKTAAVSVRIRPSLKARLEALAEADKRPFASYIEIVLEQHVEKIDAKPDRARKS